MHLENFHDAKEVIELKLFTLNFSKLKTLFANLKSQTIVVMK